MERRPLHLKGPELSRIVVGAWRWDTVSAGAVSKLIASCLDNDITSFDHADIYGDHSNEEIFGNVLKKKSRSQKQNGDCFKMRRKVFLRKKTEDVGKTL